MGNKEWRSPAKGGEDKKVEAIEHDVHRASVDSEDTASEISEISSIDDIGFNFPPLREREMDLILLQDYVRDASQKQYDVEVTNARTVRHNLRKVRIFKCDVAAVVDEANPHSSERFTLERKASEFKVLCEVLRESLPGVFAPPPSTLAKEHFWNHPKDERVRHAIQACLEELLSHPFIRQDRVFLDFLTGPEEFTHARAETVKTEENKGRKEWNQMLKAIDAIEKPAIVSSGLETELRNLLKHYENVRRDVHTLLDHMRNHNKAMASVSSSVAEWHQYERTGLSLLKPHLEFSDSISRAISTVEMAYNKDSKIHDDKTETLSKILHEDLNIEMDLVKRFLREVRRLKKPLKQLERMRKHVDELKKSEAARKEEMTKSGKKMSDPDQKLAGIQEKLMDAEKKEKVENEKVSNLFKGLFGVELFRFRVHRSRSNVRILKKLATSNQEVAAKSEEAWRLCKNMMPDVPEEPAIMYLMQHPTLAKPPAPAPPAPEQDVGKMYKAIRSFEKRNETERNLEIGEIIVGTIRKDKPEFVYVANGGFVPLSALVQVDIHHKPLTMAEGEPTCM